MDELPLKAKAFLSEVRSVHEPPPGARERVRAQLATAAVGSGPQSPGHHGLHGRLGKLATIGLATGLIAILGSTGYLLRREPKEPTRTQAPSNAEAARTAPPPRDSMPQVEASAAPVAVAAVTAQEPPRRSARREKAS